MRYATVVLIAALVLAFLPAYAAAQTETVTFQFYRQNTAEPFSTYVATQASFQCNQTPLPAPTSSTFVPRFVSWDDERNIGRSCIFDANASAPTLFVIPIGGVFYIKAIRTVDGAQSPLSEASNPFVLPPSSIRNVRLHGGGN